VTLFVPFIVTTHAPLPVHAPLQPVKVEPVAGVFVTVTTVPWLYVPPGGLRVTAPLPALVHPVHARGAVFGWEILGALEPAK
jgi:hypothetical protein